jgi:hypothetical protein
MMPGSISKFSNIAIVSQVRFVSFTPASVEKSTANERKSPLIYANRCHIAQDIRGLIYINNYNSPNRLQTAAYWLANAHIIFIYQQLIYFLVRMIDGLIQ